MFQNQMFNQQMQPMQPQYPQYGRGCRGMPNYNQFVPSTNKQFVRSLEEALSLPADFNSQNVYFDVNKNVMYDICTNGNGEKSWSILNISLSQNSSNIAMAGTANNEATNIENRLARLETKLEELLNGKHNAESSNAANE